jgi:adenosylhomocysteine nucleosidase
MMRLLFVASDSMEYPGILARAKACGPAAVAADWARAGRLGSHDILLVANGAGPKRAAAAVDAALRKFTADAVVSTGFCGALDPALQIADVVIGTSIAAGAHRFPAAPIPGPGGNTGVICSIDHVAQTAEEKRQLRESGASAVEMEAAGVAARTQAHGLPFYCVRAVTDLAGETMANDFNSALRPDGHFDTMIILRGVLRHPFARGPELLRLRERCARAARILGDFFADSRI